MTLRPQLDIHFGDNLDVISEFADASFDLIYIDPPFNTGKKRSHARLQTVADEDGDRTGFGGRRYRSEVLSRASYLDSFTNFEAFIGPRLLQAHRLLAPTGSLFVHLDFRESHYVKVMLDGIFGRDNFVNEIIWAYDFGGRSKRKWPAKHDTILLYARTRHRYTFHYDELPRIPYMAPGLVGKAKAARGKTPTDVWWHTIVPTNGKERTGYPTQKPRGVLDRIIGVHSSPGDRVLDFFAGSGTTGEAAVTAGRQAVLVDANPEAMSVMHRRLRQFGPTWHGWSPVDTGE